MEPEFRNSAPLTTRGRTLIGTVLAYGEEALVEYRGGLIRERFVPGAFDPVPAVPLVMQHDEAMPIARAGEYELRDSRAALEIQATLPEKSAAAHLVKTGALSGYSVKFVPLRESMQAGIRVIERASLKHVGLVDSGAYSGSVAEVRARGKRGGRLGTLRGRVPAGKTLDCRCSPGKCVSALFKHGSLDNVPDQPEALAIIGEYANAIAAKSKGGVRFWNRDGNLEFAVDVPSTPDGEKLLRMMDDVPIFGRPVVDTVKSTMIEKGAVAEYSKVRVRAITVGPTDATAGWTALRLGKDGEGPPEERRESPRRLRQWL